MQPVGSARDVAAGALRLIISRRGLRNMLGGTALTPDDADAEWTCVVPYELRNRGRQLRIIPKGQFNDLWARLETTKRAAFCHSARLRNRPARLKLVLSDSAPGRAQSGQVGCSALAVAR